MSRFAPTLIAWQRRDGRRNLPWQGSRDPYRIWLAEIMLQQTQVAAVAPYYERFLARFPDVAALARAPLGEVLRLWSGLGYYARARNLHRAARVIVNDRRGRFPATREGWCALPGVGRSTAGAVAAFAFAQREAILDGNVKRLLARCFGVEGYPGETAVAAQLWSLAESLLPRRDIETYTQALMDIGATLCTRSRPDCSRCPLSAQCVALRTGRVDVLPAPRPRRARPLRRETWLIAVREDRVLLERRPAEGLWGGLWAFPRVAKGGRAADRVRQALGAAPDRIFRRASFEHGFTHFRLRVQPLETLYSAPPPRRPDGARWMRLAQAAQAAVPAPVACLLRGLVSASNAEPARPARRRAAQAAPRRRRSRAASA